MKSGYDSVHPVNKWRLRRTLRRSVDFRPIEDSDVPYAFAAYKLGSLDPMGITSGLSAKDFKSEFEQTVLSRFFAAWTLFAGTRKGFIPVGMVFAEATPNKPFMTIDGMVWFPWSSKRNKIESAVNFLDRIRKEYPLMFYAVNEHKRMYEVCAMHGIVRRVGTSYVAVPGKAAAVFETRNAG